MTTRSTSRVISTHCRPRKGRVYLALARLWKPAATKEIADLARLDTNRCSALLGRLVQRGAVTVTGGTAWRRQYYLTERLYNIYYLLRRGAGTSTHGGYSDSVHGVLLFARRVAGYRRGLRSRSRSRLSQETESRSVQKRTSLGLFGAPLILRRTPAARVEIVGENEVATLLPQLAAMNRLPEGCVSTLIQFAAVAGPARARDLIQDSQCEDRLLPLVTALEQTLGRSPRVAREVEEVAADIRSELTEKISSRVTS